jgi:predicted dinucleotide-binding enzyme
MKERIGILGSGAVGKTLAHGFLTHGYEVMVGSRDTSKLKEWHEKLDNPSASIGTFEETAKFGEILVLALHGTSAVNAIDIACKENFRGKIVMDITNPLDASGGMPPKLVSTQENPLGKQIQEHIPDAKVVKVFNIVNCQIMVNPMLLDGTPDMFMAGNDENAKQWVNDLVLTWGWNSCYDMGGIEKSYWLEAFAMIWIEFGFKNNIWTHAFKLLHR